MRQYTCDVCGKTQKMRGRGRPRRYCPGECARQAKNAKTACFRKSGGFDRSSVYQCGFCGAAWCNVGVRQSGRQGPTLYCTTKCQLRANRSTLKKPRDRVLTCAFCRSDFVDESMRQARKFCSNTCRDAAYGSYRKRAKFWGVQYESVNRRQVFDRDGWKCGICHERIDPKLKHPDRFAVTLDHIIPMSEGGGHVWSNVQAAHWLCNQRKGVRLCGSQLLLIGDAA